MASLEPIDPRGIADGFSPALPYTPSNDDLELATRVKRRFETAYNAKSTVSQDMDFWRRYIKGEQNHLFRNIETGEVVKLVPLDAKRLYSMNNILRPALRSLVGKMTRMVPTFQFVPPTMDADEVNGARVADAFINFFRNKENLDTKYTDAYEDVGGLGTGAFQLEWDPCAGLRKAYCDECEYGFEEDLIGQECPTCKADLEEAAAMDLETGLMEAQAGLAAVPDPEAIPALTKQVPLLSEAYEGDVRVHLRDPRDVYVEPGVTDPCKLRWLIFKSREPVAEVRRRFPEMGIFVGASNSGRYGSSLEDAAHLDEHCDLYEYHEAPTELYPQGRIVWLADDIVLDEIESPYYGLGRLPFYFFRWIINRGEFWGESFVAQAWHRQKELNQLESSIREHIEQLVNPVWLDPLGSKLAVDELTAGGKRRLKYNAGTGFKPEVMQFPDVPQGVWARRAELTEDVRIQAGITSQEAGLDVQDPNGRAMAIVEAEADQQVGPIMRRNTAEWSALHRGILILVKERYSPERKFTVSGEDNYAETFSFAELNLSPGWDIQLEVEDGLSKNQALRLTQANELLQLGVFADPQTGMPDMRKFVRVARIKIPGIGPDLVSPDYAAAMDLIRSIERQEPAEPKSFDDATIFAEVLYGWLKSNGRRKDPLVVQQVEMAWQFYTEWAMSGMIPAEGMVFGQMGQQQASQAGSDRTGPGGTPNNPGMLGTDLASGSSVGTDAQATVAMADRTAEAGAQVQAQREG